MTESHLSDIEIARNAKPESIERIAAKLDIPERFLDCYGRNKAKVAIEIFEHLNDKPDGKLILVTAITPTPAGEGKTTTSIGLVDGLNRIGCKTIACLREPSLGPCFGMKGGAAGGGYAQVIPMEEINLHFTGDLHAISAAHNLLAAMVDNHLHHGNTFQLDTRKITWNRVLDLNDRALRHIVTGLGGVMNSVPRESGFDISVASEVMAIFCLSRSLAELKEKLGTIIIGSTRDNTPVTASQLKAHGAMTVLLKNALNPNLVQTLEGNPAFVHGGPFANIAHGCNSVVATRLGLKLADYVVTEAGFGADLGAEKFLDIKCRKANLKPDLVVIVATIRALKMHGGIAQADLACENLDALELGMGNLEKHVENMRKYGLPIVVAINSFPTDTNAELQKLKTLCAGIGVNAVQADHWASGGAGAENLAHTAIEAMENEPAHFKMLYPDAMPLVEKIETVCRDIYGADGVHIEKKAITKLKQFEDLGFGAFPVCIAKTQYSFSADPTLKGRPTGFTIPIRDVRISAGAGFVVALAGDIMTMPGLPKVPAAENIDLDENGHVIGLF